MLTFYRAYSALIRRALQSYLRIEPIHPLICYSTFLPIFIFLPHLQLPPLYIHNFLILNQNKAAIYFYPQSIPISYWSFLICGLWLTLCIFLGNRKDIRKLLLTFRSLRRLQLKSIGIYFISEILALPQRIDQHFELVLQLAWLLGFISHSHYGFDNFIIIICLKYKQYGVQFSSSDQWLIRIYAPHFTPLSTKAQLRFTLLLALIRLF